MCCFAPIINMFYCVQRTILASQFEACRDVWKERKFLFSLLIFFCSFARLSACLPIMRSIPFRSIICRRLTFMKYSNYASLSPSLSSIQLSASGSFIGLNLSRNAVSDRKALKLSCPIMRTLASSYVLARKWRESKYASVYIVGICAKCVYGNVRLSRQLRLFWGDVEYATSY